MTPPISRGSRPASVKRSRVRMPYSSTVWSRAVVRRQCATSSCAAKNAEHGVGVADVERQKHQDASARRRRGRLRCRGRRRARTRSTPLGLEAGGGAGERFGRCGDVHALALEIARDFGEAPKNRRGAFGEELIVVAVEVAQQPNQQLEARMRFAGLDAQRRGDVRRDRRAFSSGSR